jgi:hypothetical protein
MKLEYHNVEPTYNHAKIAKELSTIDNATLEDFKKISSQYNHVKLYNEQNYVIKQFDRWECEVNYDYINGQPIKWFPNGDTVDFQGMIGKYELLFQSELWFVIFERRGYGSTVLTTIKGKIFYASYSDAYKNKWNAIDDFSVGYSEKMKCINFMSEVLKEICKANINVDLKEILVKKIRWEVLE